MTKDGARDREGLEDRGPTAPRGAPDPAEELTRLENALHGWGGRPARTSPAAAARRIVASLEPRRRHPFPLRLAFASAAATVLVIGLWMAARNGENGHPRAPVPPESLASGAADALTLLDENVVLWWLDPETPVYFVLAPPEARRGEAS